MEKTGEGRYAAAIIRPPQFTGRTMLRAGWGATLAKEIDITVSEGERVGDGLAVSGSSFVECRTPLVSFVWPNGVALTCKIYLQTFLEWMATCTWESLHSFRV